MRYGTLRICPSAKHAQDFNEEVNFGAEFQSLPKLMVGVLWWDEDPSEGFEAKTKFLFDARVLQVVDLESLIFACEQLTNRLLNAQS